MEEVKYCIICNEAFIPVTKSQIYCHKEITLQCSVCGANYTSMCKSHIPKTCENVRCRRKAATTAVRKSERRCRTCGDVFHPTSNNQIDCLKIKSHKCEVCGKEFTVKCSGRVEQNVCSRLCLDIYLERQKSEKEFVKTKICNLCGKEFHLRFPNQRYCSRNHFAKCKVCGELFQIDPGVSDRQTCSDKCEALLKL